MASSTTKMIELHFPLKGLNESVALSAQAKAGGGYSTARCVNVLAFDPRSGRNRGASRSGLAKFCTDTVSSTSPVQDLNHVVGFAEREYMLTEDGSIMLLEDGSTTMDLETASAPSAQRQISRIAVAGGTVAEIAASGTTSITGGTAALSSARTVIFSTQFGYDLYFADGSNYKIYDAGAEVVTSWTATAGTLPEDDLGNRATLIETWAGRIVMSGLPGDGRNWFMSAVDDPLDWNYTPAVISAAMAVAGNASDAGQLGDIVTALIPYTDDVLLIGGDHTIYRLSGNPADGGRLDLVSDITGVAVGRAWCKSPEGAVYFFGSRGGVYKMDPMGGIPQRLTANSLDERLADVHLDDNQIRMAWDDRHVGVRLFITPKDGSAGTHYFYDLRNEAWWLVAFANPEHNPRCVHLLDGYDPDDRVLLLGCQDGYVRSLDVDSTTDDGSAIASEVWIGPLMQLTVLEMQAVFSEDTGVVNWSLHEGVTLESALESGAVGTGRFVGGRNRSQWPRRHVRQGYLRLHSSAPWSLEQLLVTVHKDGLTRTRGWA